MGHVTLQKEKSYLIQTKMTIERAKKINKMDKPKYPNLRQRLEAFYQKPIEEIYVESAKEVDAGNPVGDEKW